MAIEPGSRSRIVPAIIGLALCAWSVLPATAATSSLKPLVVQTSEVTSSFGSGFRVLTRRAMTTQDVRSLQPGTTNRGVSLLLKGWVKGYFSSFYRTTAKVGVSTVTSGVSLYRNSSYPRRAMDSTMKSKGTVLQQLRKAGAATADITWLNGVGDKALLLKYSLTIPGSNTAPTLAYVVVFSRGHFAGSLSVSGHGTVPKNQVLALAAKVDGRVRHA